LLAVGGQVHRITFALEVLGDLRQQLRIVLDNQCAQALNLREP